MVVDRFGSNVEQGRRRFGRKEGNRAAGRCIFVSGFAWLLIAVLELNRPLRGNSTRVDQSPAQ